MEAEAYCWSMPADIVQIFEGEEAKGALCDNNASKYTKKMHAGYSQRRCPPAYLASQKCEPDSHLVRR